ncbi:hypothetical protein [Marinifilum caeruleilacunae]|nr:hypothetical protein [Marinifilum caeruleilacunae]
MMLKELIEFDQLNLEELCQIKGGEEREYIVVIIDGKEVRVYL